MVELLKQKEFFLYSASDEDIARLKELVVPTNSAQYPSIMRLWYDINKQNRIILFDNLFLAYLFPYEEQPFWTIGSKELSDENIKNLVTYCQVSGIKKLSFLSPELSGHDISNLGTGVLKDANDQNYDYIYDIAEQVLCEGSKFKDMRQEVRRFEKLYEKDVEIITGNDLGSLVRTDIEHLFDEWLQFGTDGSSNPEAENLAIDSLFNPDTKNYFEDILTIRIMYKDRLVGLSVLEIVDSGFAINHFQKANLNLSGIGYYIFYIVAQALNKRGVKYLNFQEDCGIAGLRQFKNEMRPSLIAKNYELLFN